MKIKKSELLIVLSFLLALVLAAVELEATRCATELSVVRYEVPAPLTEEIRIVQLTDLHGHSFGPNNEALIALVAEQEPDLILMTGDMLDRSDDNAEVVCRLIEACCRIAPVYYGYGNHEYFWIQDHGELLEPAITAAGAEVLNVDYADITVNGQALRIGGYYNYYRQPHMFPVTEEEKLAEIAFCDRFEDTDRYKILLSHIPTAWLDWGYIDKFPVDLVLMGHYHGGQIRLPILGGLYAPYIGLFPEYTQGIYDGTAATAVLSAGLGSRPGIPRLNNLPELTVIDLIPEN